MTPENLLPSHRAERRRLNRCINAWSMGLCVLAVLVGGLALGANLTRARPPAMPAGLTHEVELGRSQLGLVELQIEQLERVRLARERSAAAPRWDRLLDIVARESAGKAQLRAVHVEPDQTAGGSWSVSIVGTAESLQSPATLAERLDATGLFSRVRHGIAPGGPVDGRFEFFLECAITP